MHRICSNPLELSTRSETTLLLLPTLSPPSLLFVSQSYSYLPHFVMTDSSLPFLCLVCCQPAPSFQPHSLLISFILWVYQVSLSLSPFSCDPFFSFRSVPSISLSLCRYFSFTRCVDVSTRHMSSPAWQLSSPCIMRTGKKNASW